MPYCPKCGIQIEANRQNCPLCSFPVPEIEEFKENPQQRERYLLNHYRMKQAENRRRWKEVRVFVYMGISLSLVVLSLIFGVQDFYFSGELTWSRYVITSNLAAVVSLFFFLKFIPAFLPNFLGLGFTAGGFLYLTDRYNGEMDWFWDFGLVICINAMVWIFFLRLIIRHSRRRGLNIPAYGFFAVALACFSLEVIQNFYQGEIFSLTWSIPVITTLFPVGGLLLFLHLLLSSEIREKISRKIHL